MRYKGDLSCGMLWPWRVQAWSLLLRSWVRRRRLLVSTTMPNRGSASAHLLGPRLVRARSLRVPAWLVGLRV